MDTVVDRPHRSNSINSSSSTSNNSASSTSELFICFTSRLSSSSMKLSSKSILSPGRHRDSSQISLSNSLSRRLRSNGSMKGGQASPMFPTSTGKKRGCAFENPEPSSPKVTCIGQVRVKTKKQGKKLRTRSKRRGEISFRRVDQNNNNINLEAGGNQQDLINSQFLNQQQQQQEGMAHRNQRWVHLPVSICEALRTFGAELNCFLPCRSSCMASEKEKEEKAAAESNNSGSSCGAVFARWLVAVQEEEEGKGREIELVVGEDEEEEERDERSRRSYRRHVFEEIEFKDDNFEGGIEDGLQEEEGRVSICIPPKNALLLMRCRSDPVKMAALANKFWEAPAPQDEEDEEEEGVKDRNLRQELKDIGIVPEEEEQIKVEQQEIIVEQKQDDLTCEQKLVSCEETIEEHQIQEVEAKEAEDGEQVLEKSTYNSDNNDDGVLREGNLIQQQEEEEAEIDAMNQPALFSTPENVCLLDDFSHDQDIVDPEDFEVHENEDNLIQGEEVRPKAERKEQVEDFSDDIEENSVCAQVEQESVQVSVQELQSQKPEQEEPPVSPAVAESQVQESKEEKETKHQEEGSEQTVTHEGSEPEGRTIQGGQTSYKSKERDNSQPLLPDCLLLMMCEPKLSMEVSKETWVCSTDFIRWLPAHSRPVNKTDDKDEPKKRVSIDSNPAPVRSTNTKNINNLPQPPRSSCSYPAKPPARGAGTESMSTMIEQKLVGAKAYEPFVLTRCKSEPMRSASKLAPEACFWKNRKLEPHRAAATLGVGAAGVGF